jgi:hypothetical protein
MPFLSQVLINIFANTSLIIINRYLESVSDDFCYYCIFVDLITAITVNSDFHCSCQHFSIFIYVEYNNDKDVNFQNDY